MKQYKCASPKLIRRENNMSKEDFMRKLKADLKAGRISRRAAMALWRVAQ